MNITPLLLDELMGEALIEANKAAALGEVPVGAVVYTARKIVSRAHNLTETTHNASAHAELLALQHAAKTISNWRLTESLLVVTLEPCTMCAGAIKLFRVPCVVYGAAEPRMGAVGSLYDLLIDARTGAAPRVITDVRAKESAAILQEFFIERRKKENSIP